ncbi:MAG: 1-pyrroline-5-carboxylate dehydrogenase [Subtercola sp.]|nr:1-pyrroline-5-carboxylate dehydrogenase [Subtercola sp.]
MHAANLGEAVELQNATAYGLTAGIHSLDASEIEQWLASVETGNLYVNRGITGAIVRRQPFGGWKRSSVGAGAKAGGPNYLIHLGAWADEPGLPGGDISLAGLSPAVASLLEASTGGLDWQQFEVVRRAAVGDEDAWQNFFATADVSALSVERNVLRYRPLPVLVRLSEGEPLGLLVRVLAAATRAGAPLALSTALKLPRPLRALLKERRVKVFVESDAQWLARASAAVGGDSAVGSSPVTRIRMIGGDPVALARALGGSPDVALYTGEVARAARIELLPFLREQAVSITNHRFGNPSPLATGILP